MRDGMKWRRTLWLLLAALGPLLLLSFYVMVTRELLDQYNAQSDWIAIALSCLSGAFGVAKSAPPEWPRVIVILIYLPLMGLFLPFYSLVFVCAVFRDCL
jgi:hypothetical protein